MKRMLLIVITVLSLSACSGGDDDATCYVDSETGNIGCARITDDETCVGGVYNGEAWVDCE